MVDVAIIGCGVVGAATAYTLAQYDLSVTVLERENDVATGTTKANSAIVHAGYDPEPGTLMAKLNLRGSLLAAELGADYLIILTAVEKVAINFGKENQEWLSDLTVDQAKEYIAQEQFAKGSMLPKIEAAIRFAESGEGRRTLITLLDKAAAGIAGETGTVIHK